MGRGGERGADSRTTRTDPSDDPDNNKTYELRQFEQISADPDSAHVGSLIELSLIAHNIPEDSFVVGVYRRGVVDGVTGVRMNFQHEVDGWENATSGMYTGVLNTAGFAPGQYGALPPVAGLERSTTTVFTLLESEDREQGSISCKGIFSDSRASSSTLDIVFVGDTSLSKDEFTNRASSAATKLLFHDPFTEMGDQVNFFTHETLLNGNCDGRQNGTLTCGNQDEIERAAMSCGDIDKMVFLTGYDFRNSWAQMGQKFAIVQAPSLSKTTTVVAHELGHSIGELHDEYTYPYGTNANPLRIPPDRNCAAATNATACSPWCSASPISYDAANCSVFADRDSCITDTDCTWMNWESASSSYLSGRCIPRRGEVNVGLECRAGTGCFSGCRTPDSFRSVDKGLMSNVSTEGYGPVNVDYLREEIDKLLQ